MSQSSNWTVERERSHLWLLKLIRWIAMTAGRGLARCLLPPIALYFLVANGTARRASREYLGRVWQRPARLGEVYRHIHHFASTVLDRVFFLQGRFDCFELQITDAALIHTPLQHGEGLMAVGAHLGSFEVLRADAQHHGERVAMLMYEDNARQINAALSAIAPAASLHTIPLGRPGAMLSLRQWLDDGGIAGLLADRTLPVQSGRSQRRRFDFLGRPAPFSDGPFRLAALLRKRMVFVAGLYHGGNRYELRFAELGNFHLLAPGQRAEADQMVDEAMRRYVELLDTLCREAPYNWFNFYDFWADDDPVPHDQAHVEHTPS